MTRTRGARDTCCITPAGNTGTGHAGKLSWVHMWRAWRNAGPAAGQTPLLPLVTGLLPISGLISLHTVHDFVPDYPESSYRRVHLPEYIYYSCSAIAGSSPCLGLGSSEYPPLCLVCNIVTRAPSLFEPHPQTPQIILR